MSSSASEPPEDPLKGAELHFEEHERELLEKLMARAQRDIPEGATVAEAMAEMRRAITEDEDARELLFRVATIQSQNDGYISSYFASTHARAAALGVKYRPRANGRFSLEELELMKRIGKELEKRLPPGLSEEEREARAIDLLTNDEELVALAARLEQLSGPSWD